MARSSDIIPPTPSAQAYATAAANSPDDGAWFARTDPFALISLATADATGAPDVRMVLLKDVSPAGFVFYSNRESRKGGQLTENPVAALCFHWKSLRRQVRVSGAVLEVGAAESDAYFASRARDSQIGAWASEQSRPMGGDDLDRSDLDARLAHFAARFGDGEPPRPPQWIGWRVAPTRIEFWRDRPYRLHDRLEFIRAREDAVWRKTRLYP